MIISMRGVKKAYGGVTALDGLDLEVEAGELYAFLGPNGAGKTTAIRILNGLTRMTSGSAVVGGIDVERDPLAAKRLCGLASQHTNLDGELTLRENLDIHGRLHGMARGDRRARALEMLAYVELADRADTLVKTLSGGMKRRLMLARAMLHRPRLLFLDEPTVGLDPAIRRRIWGLVAKAHGEGVSIFLTTHYIEEAEALAGRVGFIHRGRLAAEGRPRDLIERIGQWAVERVGGGVAAASYHASREDAREAAGRAGGGGVLLRRVNLEDAFLALTGEKVQ